MIYAGRFQDRSAVITGGASGLGLEAAKRIVAEMFSEDVVAERLRDISDRLSSELIAKGR